MSVSTMIPVPPNLNSRMRKFRFIIVNSGPEGGMSMREQPQIAMAPSPQYLVQLYAASGDKIRILEELPQDEETKNYGKMNVDAAINEIGSQGWQAKGKLTGGTMIDFNGTEEELKALRAMHSNGAAPSSPQQPQPQQQKPQEPAVVHSEPKYFNVGGMECKMENGKLYQKHWVTVNETEMANYRLISDKNNRILPMTGKHLEVLKWVIVEEDAENGQ